MTGFGYALSSEEHNSRDLVRHAALAEEAGFEFVLISDHFHPWLDDQGFFRFWRDELEPALSKLKSREPVAVG